MVINPYVLFGLLLVKHFLVSNVLDVGYSRSRRVNEAKYKRYLIGHVATESVMTAVVFLAFLPISPVLAIVVEAVLQIATCVVERRASLFRALRTHLLCEGAILLMYVIYAFLFS